MSFKGFSIFGFGGLLCSAMNHFSNFGRGSPKEHFCEIILTSGHWPRGRCLKIFLFLALVPILFSGAPFCSVEWNHFTNFGRASLKEHFCEIILQSGHWPRRYCLQVFLFLALVAILFSGAEPF